MIHFEKHFEHSYKSIYSLQFASPLVNNVFHDEKNVTFFGPSIRNVLPEKIKIVRKNLKILMKKWEP